MQAELSFNRIQQVIEIVQTNPQIDTIQSFQVGSNEQLVNKSQKFQTTELQKIQIDCNITDERFDEIIKLINSITKDTQHLKLSNKLQMLYSFLYPDDTSLKIEGNTQQTIITDPLYIALFLSIIQFQEQSEKQQQQNSQVNTVKQQLNNTSQINADIKIMNETIQLLQQQLLSQQEESKAEITKLNETIQTLQSSTTVNEQAESITHQLQKIKIEKSDLEQKAHKLSQQLQYSLYETSNLQLDIGQKQNEISALHKQLEIRNEKIDRQLLLINDHQKLLDQKDKEKQHLQNTVLYLQSNQADQRAELIDKICQRDTLVLKANEQIKELQSKITQLVEEDKTKSAEYKRDLYVLQEQNKKSLISQNVEFTAQLNQNLQKISALTKENSDLSVQLMEVQNQCKYAQFEVKQKVEQISLIKTNFEQEFTSLKNLNTFQQEQLTKMDSKQFVNKSFQEVEQLDSLQKRNKEILALKLINDQTNKQIDLKNSQIQQFITSRAKQENEIRNLQEEIKQLKHVYGEAQKFDGQKTMQQQIDDLQSQLDHEKQAHQVTISKFKHTQEQLMIREKMLLESQVLLKQMDEKMPNEKIIENQQMNKQMIQKEHLIRALKKQVEDLELEVGFLSSINRGEQMQHKRPTVKSILSAGNNSVGNLSRYK
ncbi:Conserved_hypothetical protein [Hexamita inflata]|uniref:Uncharacterized protein n=1 Tax=Hexamita inflata TaxID=28002 RepID=A0AA86V6K3_9EUKA|nr:Conserved hypothetical protein [Hexamita inflata]